MRLVLFDIDGTLVTDGGAAREAFAVALGRVYGYRGDLSRYDFSGLTDPQIAQMILRDEEIDDRSIDAAMTRLWTEYLPELEQRIAGRVRALAGVEALLERLESRDDVVLALLTGNIERGARIKLDAANLNAHFPFGAFGSDSAVRAELPPIAVARASKRTAHRFTGREVVIIGDSIHDVRCGAPHDATTIAIASGKTTAERLRAENPHHFFRTAEDLESLVEAILA